MKATSFLLPVLPAFLLLLVHPVKAQTSLAEMDAAYDAAIARIEKPQVDLLAKYQEGLRALQERKRAAGDLEAVLALTREIETAAQETKREFESQTDLKRLREIYETNRARLREDASKEHARVRDDYRSRLLAATERLTREGKIDEAVQLKARAEKLAAGTSDGEVVWEWKSRASVEPVGNCQMESAPKGFIVTSPGGGSSWMKSRREFRPPFRLSLRAATDSTNIRLYYRSHLAILNWEVSPTELRVHHSGTGASTGIRGKGAIAPHEMHDIEVDVLETKVVVRVDGEVRGELVTTNAGLEGPVGIGPAFGSIVTVESMKVIRLE